MNTSESSSNPSSPPSNINTEAFSKYKFDESIFSPKEQEIFIFLSVCNKCRRKIAELQVDKFDQERFKKKETKFPHEMKTIFESLCTGTCCKCIVVWVKIVHLRYENFENG